MNIRREWATPVTAGAFLLSAITGLLLFFHLDSGLNKTFHEWIGWLLLAGAGLHLGANLHGFKRHLRERRGQMLIGGFVLLLAFSFIPLGGSDEPPFVAPARALANAPLGLVAQVGNLSPGELRERLARQGITPASDSQSLADLVGTDTRRQIHLLGALLVTDH